ncbi:MAG: hypothetical protein ACI8P3_003187, partial [Saprospiraceae bacterium]
MAFSFGNTVSAQKFTKVKGKVLDAQTKEPLPFVNISFLGTNVGMTTDFDGFYNLQSKWASDTLQVSYIGYDTQKIPLTQGEAQVINVALKESGGLFLETVT